MLVQQGKIQQQEFLWKIMLQSSAPNLLSHKNESEFSTLPRWKPEVVSANELVISGEESIGRKETAQHIKIWGPFTTKEDQSATSSFNYVSKRVIFAARGRFRSLSVLEDMCEDMFGSQHSSACVDSCNTIKATNHATCEYSNVAQIRAAAMIMSCCLRFCSKASALATDLPPTVATVLFSTWSPRPCLSFPHHTPFCCNNNTS